MDTIDKVVIAVETLRTSEWGSKEHVTTLPRNEVANWLWKASQS